MRARDLRFGTYYSGGLDWSFGGLPQSPPVLFFRTPLQYRNFRRPMEPWAAFHEDGEKLLLDGEVLPAGQGARADLDDALDAIFHHPNVGPFVCRQLIQRLVTSNPSPGYVYRCARAFANDGNGDARWLGVEAALGLTYRFAPNVALDLVAATLQGGDARDESFGDGDAKEVYKGVARVRVTW